MGHSCLVKNVPRGTLLDYRTWYEARFLERFGLPLTKNPTMNITRDANRDGKLAKRGTNG